MKIVYCLLISLIVFSCKELENSNVEKQHISKLRSINSLLSNAFVFTELESHNHRLYIIPIDEKDSIAFKKIDVISAIQGEICIQVNTGCFGTFYKDPEKKIMIYKACNLPYDSMFYSRAYINYKNYNEVLLRPTDAQGRPINLKNSDSCNTKLITETDSSSFDLLKIYN